MLQRLNHLKLVEHEIEFIVIGCGGAGGWHVDMQLMLHTSKILVECTDIY